jgi:hypothetical protein
MRSPRWTPARAAGEPRNTRVTTAVSRTVVICIPTPTYELRSACRENSASCSGENRSAYGSPICTSSPRAAFSYSCASDSESSPCVATREMTS